VISTIRLWNCTTLMLTGVINIVKDAMYAHGLQIKFSRSVKVLRECASNIIKVVGLRASIYVGRFTRIHSQS
jgi:hypothetical protein